MSNTITARTVAAATFTTPVSAGTIRPVVLTQDQLVAATNGLAVSLAETDDVAGQWLANLAVTFASTATHAAATKLLAAMPSAIHNIAGGSGEAVAFQLATVGRFMLANVGDETITYESIVAARKAIKDATGGKGGVAMSRKDVARVIMAESASTEDIAATVRSELARIERPIVTEDAAEVDQAPVQDQLPATPQELINNVASILNADILRNCQDALELDVVAQLLTGIIRQNKIVKARSAASVAA